MDYYDSISKIVKSNTMLSGRYSFQYHAEKRAISDTIQKLELKPTDNVLDIGSNVGSMSIPISYLVNSVTCIDSPNLTKFIQEKKIDNINLLSGDFLEVEIDNKFDKILVYGVLNCLNEIDLYKFIDKCLTILNPGGILLFGDIPNISKKKRYLDKYQTNEEKESWNELISKEDFSHLQEIPKYNSENKIAIFDDDIILNMVKYIRNKDFNCYIINQKENLPFNKTREDIIVHNYA